MLKRLRERWLGRPAQEAAAIPPSVRLYAVGDIHGRRDLLERMLEAIREDAAGGGAARIVLVLLGDYIDRGPDSAGVIELILKVSQDSPFEVRCLRGNHEQALLDFLEDPGAGPGWAQFGGAETLASYGIAPPQRRTDPAAWAATRDALAAVLPPAHRLFLEQLDFSFECGDFFFVHAGVRPNVPLEQQTAADMLWIRNEFLNAEATWSKVVVHGHTPADAPHLDHRRIGLDTGAYATGVLTGLRLMDKQRKIIQVNAAGPIREGP